MCEIGFGWPTVHLVSMYNIYLRAFAVGAIGASIVLKTLAIWISSDTDRRGVFRRSIVLNACFAVFAVYLPIGSVVWLLAQELAGRSMNWCGLWLSTAALAAMAMDVILLKCFLRVNLSGRTAGLLYASNLLSLGAGLGLSIWDAIENPPFV